MTKGSEWIQEQLRYWQPGAEMSSLGERVADLLGEWQYGIYHLDPKALRKVEWHNRDFIIFSLGWKSLATTDFDDLTQLVLLAHHLALRVDIEASRNKYLRLLFHPRSRQGDCTERHPTIEEAVERFYKNVALPKYEDQHG